MRAPKINRSFQNNYVSIPTAVLKRKYPHGTRDFKRLFGLLVTLNFKELQKNQIKIDYKCQPSGKTRQYSLSSVKSIK